MYAAWARKNGHNPPWYPEFTANNRVHQAMLDHSLGATVSVTKLALKPGVSTPTFCRFPNDDDEDQSWNNRNRSPSRTPPAKRPAPNPLPIAFPTDGLQLMGHYPEPDNFFQYNLSRAQRSNPNPKNLHPKNPSMSAGSLKRPPPPTHQTDPYSQYKDLVQQVVGKCNNLEDSDCNPVSRQLYMRFHRIKAGAKVQNFLLKVHQSRQIGTLLKAHTWQTCRQYHKPSTIGSSS